MSLIQKNMRRALLVFAFCLMASNPARADLIFSNLGQSDNGAAVYNNINDLLATDFETDGTARTITNITVRLGNSSLLIALDPQLSIYSDDGSGDPGTLLQNFDTQISVPANSPNGDYNSASSGINLQANTRYWVVGKAVSQNFFGNLSWHYNSGAGTDGGPYSTVLGTPMRRSTDGGLSWTAEGLGNFFFALEGSAPVPEPGTLSLLVLGAAAIAGRGWRHRRGGRG